MVNILGLENLGKRPRLSDKYLHFCRYLSRGANGRHPRSWGLLLLLLLSPMHRGSNVDGICCSCFFVQKAMASTPATYTRSHIRFCPLSSPRCDYQSLHDALLDYLSALTAGAGISVLVIVDGMQDGDKEGTTLERRRSQVRWNNAHAGKRREKEKIIR